MTAAVLTAEELAGYKVAASHAPEVFGIMFDRLLATIEDRDKTISHQAAELTRLTQERDNWEETARNWQSIPASSPEAGMEAAKGWLPAELKELRDEIAKWQLLNLGTGAQFITDALHGFIVNRTVPREG